MYRTFSKPSSLLGISLGDREMTAALVRRAGARVEVRRSCRVELALDPLTGDSELVGREIRNHLDAAGIREKRCVVVVPLHWVLTVRTQIPNLSEADKESFLRVQADREFPFAAEDLSVAVSRYRSTDGSEHALLSALPARHLTAIQKALKSAGLRPVSVTLVIASLIHPDPVEGAAVLWIGTQDLDLEVMAGGGVAVLRSLRQGTTTQEPEADAEEIARQLRITLGQLPAALRDTIRFLRILGPDRAASALAADLQRLVAPLGLQVESCCPDDADRVKGADPQIFSAVFAAAGRLLDKAPVFEFLPPRVHWARQILNRVSARAAFWGAAAAIFAGLVFGGVFLIQHWRLSRLEKRWQAIRPTVERVEAMQEKVKIYRLWFDDSVPNLAVIRRFAEAFPEEGTVWVKSVGIKEQAKITCSGSARNDESWLNMLDKLRKTPGVQDLQVLQVRGGSPVQFTVSFQWNGGISDGI